jgi:hypothetical protein
MAQVLRAGTGAGVHTEGMIGVVSSSFKWVREPKGGTKALGFRRNKFCRAGRREGRER